jgi:putative sugar O-methyltransferase
VPFTGTNGRRIYDYIFVPNYRLDELRRLSFDLVMNVASMQEMREDQVRTYLDFIRSTLRGAFFSAN